MVSLPIFMLIVIGLGVCLALSLLKCLIFEIAVMGLS